MKSIFILLGLQTSCITLPDVYVVDHQTIMEQESSSDWVDFTKEIRKKRLNKGSYPLKKEKNKPEALKLINGDILE